MEVSLWGLGRPGGLQPVGIAESWTWLGDSGSVYMYSRFTLRYQKVIKQVIKQVTPSYKTATLRSKFIRKRILLAKHRHLVKSINNNNKNRVVAEEAITVPSNTTQKPINKTIPSVLIESGSFIGTQSFLVRTFIAKKKGRASFRNLHPQWPQVVGKLLRQRYFNFTVVLNKELITLMTMAIVRPGQTRQGQEICLHVHPSWIYTLGRFLEDC